MLILNGIGIPPSIHRCKTAAGEWTVKRVEVLYI